MSLAVDNPILNNPFEELKEYWIYDEGQPKRMSGRRPAGYYFRTGKRTDSQIGMFVEGQFKELGEKGGVRSTHLTKDDRL